MILVTALLVFGNNEAVELLLFEFGIVSSIFSKVINCETYIIITTC